VPLNFIFVKRWIFLKIISMVNLYRKFEHPLRKLFNPNYWAELRTMADIRWSLYIESILDATLGAALGTTHTEFPAQSSMLHLKCLRNIRSNLASSEHPPDFYLRFVLAVLYL
jgi:hypothetical protein